jgi:hypothetical protein
MHDSFVHIIKELQGSDSTSQAPINPNRPLHSNWVILPKPVNHLMTTQTTSPKKILEEILKNINI